MEHVPGNHPRLSRADGGGALEVFGVSGEAPGGDGAADFEADVVVDGDVVATEGAGKGGHFGGTAPCGQVEEQVVAAVFFGEFAMPAAFGESVAVGSGEQFHDFGAGTADGGMTARVAREWRSDEDEGE